MYDFEMAVKQANERHEAMVAELQLARLAPRETRMSLWGILINKVKGTTTRPTTTTPAVYTIKPTEAG